MILRRDAVANLEDVAEAAIRSRTAGRRSAVERKLPDLAREWTIDDIYSSLCSCRRQVRVDERGQVLSVAEEIAGGDNCVTRDLAFHDDIALMNQRILESIAEVIDSRAARRRRGQNVREQRSRWVTGYIVSMRSAAAKRCGAIGRHRANCLTRRQTSVDKRVDNDRAVDAAVVQSVAAAQARLTIATQVVSKTNTRTKVILVARTVRRLRQRRIYEERFRKRFVVPAQTEVQCQPRRNAPVVLSKESPVSSSLRETRLTETL